MLHIDIDIIFINVIGYRCVEYILFEKIIDEFRSNYGGLELIVESSLVSKSLKNQVLSHKKVVSERDISTLDYTLSRMAVQEEGLKIIDDYIYPYLFSETHDPVQIEKSLFLVNTFYDIYTDSQVLNAINEYLEESDQFIEVKKAFKTSMEIIVKAVSSKILPRAFTKLLLKDLALNSRHRFIDHELQIMPEFFQEKVKLSSAQVYETPQILWQSELDLYDHKWSERIKHKNFSDTIEEVRWVLNFIKKNPNVNVYYPENKGYESLLFCYQKEFFENQVFTYSEDPSYEELRTLIQSIKSKISFIQSKYQKSPLGNLISFNQIKSEKISFQEFLYQNINEESIKDKTLNFFSEIMIYLEDNFLADEHTWLNLIEKKFINLFKSSKKIKTNLNFYSFGQPPEKSDQDSIILGWGAELFQSKAQDIIPLQLAHKIQTDLGINSKSLFLTQSHSVFKFLYGGSFDIIATCPKISLKGDSRHPGLLKTLQDKDGKSVFTDRSFRQLEVKNSNEEKKRVKETLVLSASSLGSYYNCPKKYYFEKEMKLQKKVEDDYIMSARDEGVLMHKIMEELKKVESKHEINESLFKEIVFSYLENDNVFLEWRKEQILLHCQNLWPFFKSELQFVKDQEIDIYKVEKKFVFYVNSKTNEISKEKGSSDIEIKGSIDRIDKDTFGNLLLYDYKRSSASTYAISTYKEESPLNAQAFLYYMAADLGCVGTFNDILGFQFINLGSHKREKGFLFKELYKESPLVKEKSGVIDKVKFDSKLDLFKKRLLENINKIKSEQFDASPVKIDNCKKCDWRYQCTDSPSFI